MLHAPEAKVPLCHCRGANCHSHPQKCHCSRAHCHPLRAKCHTDAYCGPPCNSVAGLPDRRSMSAAMPWPAPYKPRAKEENTPFRSLGKPEANRAAPFTVARTRICPDGEASDCGSPAMHRVTISGHDSVKPKTALSRFLYCRFHYFSRPIYTSRITMRSTSNAARFCFADRASPGLHRAGDGQ